MKKINKYLFIITLSFIFFENSFAIQPYEFVQQTTDEASEALNKRLSKDEKMEKLKVIAKKNNHEVEIKYSETLLLPQSLNEYKILNRKLRVLYSYRTKLEKEIFWLFFEEE